MTFHYESSASSKNSTEWKLVLKDKYFSSLPSAVRSNEHNLKYRFKIHIIIIARQKIARYAQSSFLFVSLASYFLG